jgi:hypothetical protein
MLAYAVAAPTKVMRRVRAVDVWSGCCAEGDGEVEGGEGGVGSGAVKLYVEGLQRRVKEVMRGECRRGGTMREARAKGVVCEVALMGGQGLGEEEEEVPRVNGKGKDGLVRVRILPMVVKMEEGGRKVLQRRCREAVGVGAELELLGGQGSISMKI